MKSNSRIFFLANSCHICKTGHPSVACEICHMIFYCSEEHRREHWQAHSHLCRAIFKLSQQRGLSHVYEGAHGASSEHFRSLRHSTAAECFRILGRPLDGWELEILYYPKMCSSCFLMHFENSEDLEPCTSCDFVYTCRKNHFNKNHSRWCSTLKTYCDIIRYLHNGSAPAIPEIPLKNIPNSMTEVVDLVTDSQKVDKILQSFASELLTYPLTVLSGLQLLDKKDNLTVHIIGAELQAEVLPLWKWETFLLHFLPHCRTMSLVFIGPDLQDLEDEPMMGETRICKECRNTGRKLQYKLVPRTFYHEYLQANGSSKPDLFVSLNNGIYRSVGFQCIDSWKPTLEVLFSSCSPPVLITEYTLYEITQDKQIIQERFPGTEIVKAADVNPFASLKPSLNVISDEEVPVIFKNFFYMVLNAFKNS